VLCFERQGWQSRRSGSDLTPAAHGRPAVRRALSNWRTGTHCPPPQQDWRIIRKNFFRIYDLMTRFPCLRTSCLAAAIGGSALVGMAPAAQAAITEYTNKAAFEAALAPGAYTETQMLDNYPNYSGGWGFSYGIAASDGSVGMINTFGLQANSRGPSTLTFSFGSGIKAFGGYFYKTDFPGNFVGGLFTIAFNGGTASFSETSTSATTFYGFISDDDLIDALISVANIDFATVGTVIVGTVPVPGPLPLLGVGAAFGWSRRLRRRLVAGRPGFITGSAGPDWSGCPSRSWGHVAGDGRLVTTRKLWRR